MDGAGGETWDNLKGDTMKTYVRFVQFKGEILAVFMRSSANRSICPEYRDCYSHIGQHGRCYDGMEKRKRATQEQYQPLKNELEAIGYDNLIIMQ